MMYSVMIIDDKPVIREALIRTIGWEKLECAVVAEASNGLEARELIIRERPDIIISDIRMPGMDGLELTGFVRGILPDTKVIIITGYQEFEYAKKALQLGVFDFLLKPLDNKNVEDVLSRAVSGIRGLRDRMEYQSRIIRENDAYRRQEGYSRKLLQARMLYEAATRRRNLTEMSQEEQEKLGLDGYHYIVVVGRVRTPDTQLAANAMEEITNAMVDYDKCYGTKMFEMLINHDVVYYIFSDIHISSRLHNARIKNHLCHINDKLREKFGVGCCFAVSQVSTGLEQAADSFEQALGVLDSCYFTSGENVLFSNNYNLLRAGEEGYIIQDLDKFYQGIETLSSEDLEQELSLILDKITASAKGNEFQIKCLLGEIGITIMRHYYTRLFSGNEYENSLNRMIQEIDSLADIQEARNYLLHYVESVRLRLKEAPGGRNPLAEAAAAYLMEHYAEDISLTALAEHLSANPSYLSRLLKQETGKNFTDILTGIRISRAKQLLNEPGSRITEVCEKVGYSDYSYFYQVFKKVENISPSEYKRLGKKI